MQTSGSTASGTLHDRAHVITREREFHNDRFSRDEDPRAHLDRWYLAVRRGAEEQDRQVVFHAGGAAVLEYGCADGALSINHLCLPNIAGHFEGIDISDVAIAKANNALQERRWERGTFRVMNGEAMDYGNDTFDLIFGRGIIHHLNLTTCFSELHRVLKPGGRAIFYEPLGHNPILNWYRRRTPDLRTADEHPLLMKDIRLARRHFSRVSTRFFGLFTVIGVCFDPQAETAVFRSCEVLDRFALSVPLVRRYAWYCLLTLTK